MKASTFIVRLASLAVLFVPIGAHAAATDHGEAVLKEIIITAQLRKQNLQRVPIAVTPMTGA